MEPLLTNATEAMAVAPLLLLVFMESLSVSKAAD
jgi:hypothetical protein